MNRVVFSFRSLFLQKTIKSFLFLFFAFLLGVSTFCSGIITGLNSYCFKRESAVCCSTIEQSVLAAEFPSIKDILNDFFGIKKDEKKDNREITVYPGGFPLGFTMECKGVLIVAVGSVQTERGAIKPTAGKNIKTGDVLYSINEEVVLSSSHLHELLNKQDYDGGFLNVEIHRNGQKIKESVKPEKEVSSNMYRLGLWIRDNAAGVGTLTYVREDNLRFGALGHPVCDIDTGKIMPIYKGNIYKCNIVGFNKGLRGNPGELRGLFLRNYTMHSLLQRSVY